MQTSTLVKSLALASSAGILIFAGLVTILHLLRPELNPLSHTVSEYAIGPYSSLMTIAFILRGLGEASLAAGFALVPGRVRSWPGLALLTLPAICSFLESAFPADFQNAQTLLIHSLGALLGFVSLGLAALTWSRRFRQDPVWRESAVMSFVLGLLILFSLVGWLLGPRNLAGLLERVLEVFIICWLVLIAWRLYLTARLRQKELIPLQR